MECLPRVDFYTSRLRVLSATPITRLEDRILLNGSIPIGGIRHKLGLGLSMCGMTRKYLTSTGMEEKMPLPFTKQAKLITSDHWLCRIFGCHFSEIQLVVAQISA